MAAKGESSRAKYSRLTLTRDELRLKKEMRKISNRESARRSRLRKQYQFEQLEISVGELTHENNLLRDELKRLSGKRDELASENLSLKEKLSMRLGTEKVDEDVYLQSSADEDNN